MLRWGVGTLTLTLLDAAGQALTAALPADGVVSCVGLSGLRLTVTDAAPGAALRCGFLGVSSDHTWESWAQGPRLPAPGALTLEGLPSREHREPLRSHAELLDPDGVLIVLQPLSAAPHSAYTLRFAPGPYALLLRAVTLGAAAGATAGATEPALDLPPRASYPPRLTLSRRGDELAAAVLAETGGRPTVDAVTRRVLPYSGHALLGAFEGPLAAATWEGGLLYPEDRAAGRASPRRALRLTLGGRTPQPRSHGLQDGWLPIHEVQSQVGAAPLLQHSFVDPAGVLRVRWQGAALLAPGARLWATRVTTRPCAGDGDLRVPRAEPAPAPALRREGSTLSLALPLGPPRYESGTFDQALHQTREHFRTLVQGGAQLHLPDARLQDLWRALLCQLHLFQREGTLRYGVFPSAYEGLTFGCEEGWGVLALAQLGQGATASRLLAATLGSEEFLRKEGPHHQGRQGTALHFTLLVQRLLRADKAQAVTAQAALQELWPRLRASARWIVSSLQTTRTTQGQRPIHHGLMPKNGYGGDLQDPTYSIVSSAACWRGLRDAATLARWVGDDREAQGFAAEAQALRRDLLRALDAGLRRDVTPPFLPLRVDPGGAQPDAHDYYQLFASLVLETGVLGSRDPRVTALLRYLEATGRLLLGLPRFDDWYGRPGVDAAYVRGLQSARLQRRDATGYWLALCAQVGLACDPQVATTPETTLLRCTGREEHERRLALARDPGRWDSEPCSAGAAVLLLGLRDLLLCEERGEDDEPTGVLLLLPAAPLAWFQPDTELGFDDLPSASGPVSLRCQVSATQVTFTLRLPRPTRCELCYADRDGQRRSLRRLLGKESSVTLPR